MTNKALQQKPDPTIKKKAIRSRRSATLARRIQGLVVAVSVASTMMGWALFAQHDAQVATTAQLEESTSVVTSIQQVGSDFQTPTDIALQAGSPSQFTPTPASNAAQGVSLTPLPAAMR